PHLRSTYPVELQELLNSMDENEIRSGSTQSLPAASAPSTSSSVAEFRAPAAPSLRRQTRSQTQRRTLASSSSSEENTREASSRGRGSSSSSSSRQSSAVRRAASPASTDSTEQLPQKKAKYVRLTAPIDHYYIFSPFPERRPLPPHRQCPL